MCEEKAGKNQIENFPILEKNKNSEQDSFLKRNLVLKEVSHSNLTCIVLVLSINSDFC